MTRWDCEKGSSWTLMPGSIFAQLSYRSTQLIALQGKQSIAQSLMYFLQDLYGPSSTGNINAYSGKYSKGTTVSG